MTVELVAATRADDERLRALFELYTYDLSDVLQLELGDDGRYARLDGYLGDPSCEAFLIRADGRLAGFAIVRKQSRLDGDPAVRDMAELFVARRHRRRHVGEQAAAALFDRFPARWEVRQKAENVAATAFWRRVIARYTGGRFEEQLVDDARWRGPVQRFDSR